MFIVSLSYTRPIEEVDALLSAHRDWLQGGFDSGLLHAAGRKLPRTGGIILARAQERSALEQFLALDPFALANVAHYDIIEFIPTMTSAELKDLL